MISCRPAVKPGRPPSNALGMARALQSLFDEPVMRFQQHCEYSLIRSCVNTARKCAWDHPSI